jgi:hypothetical protein
LGPLLCTAIDNELGVHWLTSVAAKNFYAYLYSLPFLAKANDKAMTYETAHISSFVLHSFEISVLDNLLYLMSCIHTQTYINS